MPGVKRLVQALEADDAVSADGAEVGTREEINKRPRLREKSNALELMDDESTDEAEEAVQVTQLADEARQKAAQPSKAAENGIVESITCTNFMCHAHLHVELGPLINFVIGHNGSGKSAVLTALTICLGGKASSTNRGSTLKAFIKEGKDSCTLSVKVKNKDGYQHDVYGDAIQIERTFSRTGSSGFKIKNANGRIVSTTKTVLDEILDYYALVLDNPICVLTQDMARQFLSNSTPADKYKLFIKGIQLEQLNQDYDLLNDYIDRVESSFEKKEENKRDLDRKVRETQARMDMLLRQAAVRAKIDSLGAQMAWAQVEEQEKLLQGIQVKLQEMESGIQSAELQVEEKSAAFERVQKSLDDAQAAENLLRQQAEPVEKELEEADAQIVYARKELDESDVEQRTIKDQLRSAQREISKAERDIEEEIQRLEEAAGESLSARLEKLANGKRKIEEAQRESQDHRHKLPELLRQEQESKRKVDECSGLRQSKNQEIQKARNRVHELESNGNQQRRGYPNNMDRLVAALNQDKSFGQMPIGPIGNHMHLKKPEWSSILEKTFGSVLNSFIVTSRLDRERLNATMKRIGCITPISILSNQTRFDTSANEPDPRYSTISRIMLIDNDLVYNQLVISQRIDQMLLIENEEEATQLMSSQRLKMVKACYTMDQGTANLGHAITWGSSGGLSSTFIEAYQGIARMKTNIDDQIKIQYEYINHLKKEMNELDGKYRHLQQAWEASRREVARHSKETADLKLRVQRAEEKTEKVQEEIDNSKIEEGRLQALQETLKKAQGDEALYTSALEENVVSKDQLVEIHRQHEDAVKAIAARKRDITACINKAITRVTNMKQARLTALQNKNTAYEQLDNAKSQVARLRGEHDAQDSTVQEYIRQASLIAARVAVPVSETVASLDRKLAKLINDVECAERALGGNRAKITSDHHEATKALHEFSQSLAAEQDLLQLLKATLNDRRYRWAQFRKRISARARITFMHLLSERAFKGSLAIDHSTRLLDLRVQPDEMVHKSAARQTKTLSGGEKSFSTICLLLSLWEAIGAPIRCLDEFDVFMDTANREISMKLLINAARQARERQFIFITPQSMGSVDRERDVKIIKMQDPERGQTSLAFAR